MSQNYYLAYLSANESDHFQDFQNIYLMTRFHPGISNIQFYIVISEVKETEEKALDFLARLLENCEWIDLKKIILKSNVGRDFSSAHAFLSMISVEANLDDVIMIRNRSAHGPFRKNWYQDYMTLLTDRVDLGLVGSTINFSGLYEGNRAHVQSYVYVSTWKHISRLMDDFPGIHENEWADIVEEGEIGLSQRIMKLGLCMGCLNWPGQIFTLDSREDDYPERKDHKATVVDLPFLHRENDAFRWRKLIWKQFLKFRYLIPKARIAPNFEVVRQVKNSK